MAAERQRQRSADDHEQLQHASIVAGVGPKINAGRVLARVTSIQPAWPAVQVLSNDSLTFICLGHWHEGITAQDMSSLVWGHPVLIARAAFTEWTASAAPRTLATSEGRQAGGRCVSRAMRPTCQMRPRCQ